MAAMTSSEQNFQNLRKTPFQNVDMNFWSKFNQNWPDSVDKKGCDEHTDGQTDTAHPRSTYSVLNIKIILDV